MRRQLCNTLIQLAADFAGQNVFCGIRPPLVTVTGGGLQRRPFRQLVGHGDAVASAFRNLK